MLGMHEVHLKKLKMILEETEGHGKNLFMEARELTLWEKTEQHKKLAPLWKQIRELGEDYVQKPLELLLYSEFILFGKTGDRSVYQEKYFDRRTRLNVFAMLYLLEGKLEWRSHLEDTIWAICEEYTWVLPAHVGLYHPDYPLHIWDQPKPPRDTVDLFAAETAFSLAEITNLLGEELSPWVVHRVQEEIDQRIFQVFFHDPAPQNWEMKTNNWPSVCASSIGSAALYLVRDSERLSGMLWRVFESLKNHLSGFDEQGATAEGVNYWQFGFGYYVYFSELLKERTEGQVDLLLGEKIGRIALFPNACMLSGKKVINFSDASGEVDFILGLLNRLRKRFPLLGIPDQEAAPVFNNWVVASRNMLWSADLDSFSQDDSQVNEPIDHYFSGHQWVIAKSKENDQLVAFAAKGGHNEEPHNHNDLGHFILHVQPENVFVDLGTGVYTRQYFQPEFRYQQLTAGSHGHSVPIVDGCHQSSGANYKAEVLDYQKEEDQVTFRLNLTKAYDCQHLERLERTFVWKRKETYQLVLTDAVQFLKKPRSFEEVFMTYTEPREIQPGEVQVGPVMMTFDAKVWDIRFERHKITGNEGKTREVWRMILRVVRLKQAFIGEICFTIQPAS